MFRKSDVNKTVYFLVLLKYREIIAVKTVSLYKKLGTNFVLLCQSRNMVGLFKKAYLID